MIPAPFDYVAAESAAHAIELLSQHGDDAKVLAGGHSLLPMMKLRLAAPELLIDIARVADLAGISVDGDELVIGATTRHADLAASELVRADAPLLAHAASLVGDPQIRHRGTIGGSLAHADPAADLPMALVALGGSVELTGAGGTRLVAADDFFAGFFETALEPGELLTAVRVPRRPGCRGATRSSCAGPTTGPSSAPPPSTDGSRWPTWGRCRSAPAPPSRPSRTARAPPRRPGWPPRGHRLARTSTPTGRSASTSRGCSRGGRSSIFLERKRAEPVPAAAAPAAGGRIARGNSCTMAESAL